MLPVTKLKKSEEDKINTSKIPKNVLKIPNSVDQILSNLDLVDKLFKKLRCSTYNPIKFPSLEELLESPKRIHFKYQAASGWPLSLQKFQEKQIELNEIHRKIKAGEFHLPKDGTLQDHGINTKHWLTFDILLSVEYLKTLEFFQFLDFRDKLVLAKEVTVVVKALTSSFAAYQQNADCFVTPDGCYADAKSLTMITQLFTGAQMKTSTLLQYNINSSQAVMGCLIRSKITYNEYILLKAIAACNPIFELSENARKIVQNEREKYANALFKLCRSKQAPGRFLEILSYLNTAIYHQKEFCRFIMFMRGNLEYLFFESNRRLEDSILCEN